MFPNILAEIARNNMTIEQLAERLGVTRQTVGNWLNGKTEIPAPRVVKMAIMFRCSTDYLLGLDDNRRSA